MDSNLRAMASKLLAMVSNLRAMASNLLAMPSNLPRHGLQPTYRDGLQPTVIAMASMASKLQAMGDGL